MAPVTRSVARRSRVVDRIQCRLIGGSRVSARLARRRMDAISSFMKENESRGSRYNRRMAGYCWERMANLHSPDAQQRFGRQLVRLMGRYPEMVDASPEVRRVMTSIWETNKLDGVVNRRLQAVRRRIGSTGYYTL
jgi:hypothetical protein